MKVHEKGKFGELFVEKYLVNKGYHIKNKNWHCRYGEIDIVASKNEVLFFIEVKFRILRLVRKFPIISRYKLAKLRRTVYQYISQNDGSKKWSLEAYYVFYSNHIFLLKRVKITHGNTTDL